MPSLVFWSKSFSASLLQTGAENKKCPKGGSPWWEYESYDLKDKTDDADKLENMTKASSINSNKTE